MMRMIAITVRSLWGLVWLLALADVPAALAQTAFDWADEFGIPGMSGPVSAFVVFDDGTGPALYVGGYFTFADRVPANRIAKWNGTSWSALSSGMDGSVLALTVYNDGSGSALYAGGGFLTAGGVPANYIAKWDGTRWSALGSGV